MKYRIIISVLFIIVILFVLEIKTDEPHAAEGEAPVNAEQPAPASSPNFNL